MEELFTRVWENLIGRVGGPMKLRLVLQPAMATIFAIRGGLADARAGRPPYLWSVFTARGHRKELLLEGWKSVGKVYLIAVIVDLVYQYIVFRSFYPGEALLVAALLALVPYVLVRGPLNRIVRGGITPPGPAGPEGRSSDGQEFP